MRTMRDHRKAQQVSKPTACRACGGKGQVVKTKDGKTASVKCITCRGTGSAQGNYSTK